MRAPLAVLAALPLAGCASALPPRDPRVERPAPPAAEEAPAPGVCRNPAGEFGASACASVSGRVVGRDGKPVTGWILGGIVLPEGPACPCNSPGIVIRPDGTFAETVHWLSGYPPPAGTAIPATVRAHARTAHGPDVVHAEARVTLRFVPRGERVIPAEVELRLPLP